MWVYIWKSLTPRTPDPTRTRFYFPFESNANDYSWRTDITISTTPSNVSYASLWGVNCINGNWSSSKVLITPNWIINKNTDTYWTFGILFYANSYSTGSSYTKILEFAIQNTNYISVNFANWSPISNISTNSRHSYIQTGNKTTQTYKIYIDWVLVTSWTNTDQPRWNWTNSYEQAQYVLCNRWGNTQYFNWWVREFFAENIEWTEQQIAEYYEWIKQELGI